MAMKTEHLGTADEYNHLKLDPNSKEIITLKDVKGHNKEKDEMGNTIVRFRFNGKNLLKTYMPLEANPREPGSSTAVTRMRLTLRDNSESFHLKNNGLTIFASGSKYNSNKNQVSLEFTRTNQGICNGGHTYFAVSTALKQAQVKEDTDFFINAEVIIHPSSIDDEEYRKETVEISRARNTNSQLKEFSMADQLGYFQPLRDQLRQCENLVLWHENDKSAIDGAVKVENLMRYLACLSPDIFSHSFLEAPSINHKPASIGSKAKIWTPWFKACEKDETPKLANMYPLVLDVLKLREHLSERILNSRYTNAFRRMNLWQEYMDAGRNKRTHLFDESKKVIQIGDTVEVMILGLMRDNVSRVRNSRGKTTMIGWYVDPFKKAGEKINDLMLNLGDSFSNNNNDAKAFVRDDAVYGNQMISWDVSMDFVPSNKGYKLYDIDTGSVYRYSKNKADHRLDEVSGKMVHTKPPGQECEYRLE